MKINLIIVGIEIKQIAMNSILKKYSTINCTNMDYMVS